MQLNEPHTEHENASTSLKVVLLVFAVVLVGALGYFVWEQKKAGDTADYSAPTVKKVPTATTAKDETADWKTYTGAYFSFKYPLNWEVATGGLGEFNSPTRLRLVSPETRIEVENSDLFEIDFIDFQYYERIADEGENKVNGYGATTLDELMTKSPTITKIGAVTINGVNGYDGIRVGKSEYYSVYLSKSGHLYEIIFDHRGEKANVSSTENLIIKSFKVNN